MAYLRHSSRQIVLSVGAYLETHLAALGWMDDTLTPAGAPTVAVWAGDTLPFTQPSKFQAGTLYVSLGDEPDADEEELGGRLHSQIVPVFMDCVMDKGAHSLMLANDVRDILRGRPAGASRHLPVTDFGQTPAVLTNWIIEFEDITRERPSVDTTVAWHVVKASAVVYFLEDAS